MRKPNYENNVCPKCGRTLRRNGHTKSGKLRFRCPNYLCRYNETVNGTAHNSNIRTAFGYSKLDAINKQRIRSYRAYHTTKAQKCFICGSSDNLEQHEFNYTLPIRTFTVCRNCHKHLTQLNHDLEQNPTNPELINLLLGTYSTVQTDLAKNPEPHDCLALTDSVKEGRGSQLMTES
jgi:hypothetical protein